MLLGLLFLALGMGVLIGLFTRNRLHSVSAAYRTSLEILGRRAEELFQSEQQLRTTLDSIGDGVITCDADGRVQMMNPVARELTGWSQAEAGGQPLEKVFHIVNETSRETVETPVSKVKRLKRIIGMANHTVLIRKDGTELNIADSGAPIRDQRGETIGIVLVFRDITMERKTQDALIANEKLAVAGRLAATIAHEIHNPLDSVSNLLYLMRNGASKEESIQFMDMAEQELARVTQISRAMLGLYRESKAPVAVDLKEMLQEILLLMERRLSDLGVTVSTDMPKPVSVAAFPAELRQVFTNLITNAAEAASPGGEVKISITPQTAGVDADRAEVAGRGDGDDHRQRRGSTGGRSATPVSAVLHHQRRAWNRTWALGQPWNHQQARRHNLAEERHQRGGTRHGGKRLSGDEPDDQRRWRLGRQRPQLVGDDRSGLLARSAVNIVVGDEADRVRTDGADQHALLLQRGGECRSIAPVVVILAAQLEDDDVGLHGFKVDLRGLGVCARRRPPAGAHLRGLHAAASASRAAR